MLKAHKISFSYSRDSQLIYDVSFVQNKERRGLVGANGTGKSTLLRILAEDLLPGSGTLEHTAPFTYLSQDIPREAKAILGPWHPVLEAFARVESQNATAEDWLYLESRWQEPAKIETQCEQWGLSRNLSHFETWNEGTLQRLRLALIFLEKDRLLLLDEPSNHLDKEGRALLKAAIRNHKGGLIIASHDRDLLEEMDEISELTAEGLKNYGGAYTAFYTESQKQKAKAEADRDHHKKELKKIEREIQGTLERQVRSTNRADKNRDKLGLPKILLGARKSKAENSLAKLEKTLEKKRSASEDSFQNAKAQVFEKNPLHLDLRGRVSHDRSLLSLKNLNHSFEEKPLWKKPLFLEIRSGERWCLKGKNGSGKSTLLKIITQELTQTSGECQVWARSLVLLDQNLSLLPDNESLYTLWQNEIYDENTALNRTVAARMGLDAKLVMQNFQTLSGGQRMRAALVVLSTRKEKPDFIILDEPSNHLDIETLETLEETLLRLNSALLVVSHDEVFLERLELDHTFDLDD